MSVRLALSKPPFVKLGDSDVVPPQIGHSPRSRRSTLPWSDVRLLPAFPIEMVPGLEIFSGFLGTTSAFAEAILNYHGSDRVRSGQKTNCLPVA
jgi:hypothetical protein